MSIWEIFSLTLLKFSVGTWFVVLALWSREIRRSFYVFNAATSATLVTLALLGDVLATKRTDPLRLGGLTTFIVCGVMASALHRMEKHGVARLFGVAAVLVGAVLVVAAAWQPTHEFGATTMARWLLGIGFLSGAVLLGASHATMVLGHWYLVMRQLSFVHLRRYTLAFAIVIVLRLVVCIGLIAAFNNMGTAEADGVSRLLSMDRNGMFFAMRLGGGIVLPAVLAYMSYRCVQLKANQAATGLLYLAEVAVLFGEVFASYLLV
jgi:hypothetical protein